MMMISKVRFICEAHYHIQCLKAFYITSGPQSSLNYPSRQGKIRPDKDL